jgi:PIN domain nuclease of toxin-antitoxin system
MIKVFDASCVLAALFDEAGSADIVQLWGEFEGVISAVNHAEVVTKLAERGATEDEIHIILEGVPLTVLPFDENDGIQVGLLRPMTKTLGLSLGDRACIALGKKLNATIITADKAWKGIKRIEVVVVR